MTDKILADCPDAVRQFLYYMETIQGKSPRTIEGYYIDLRTFFRFYKVYKNWIPQDSDLQTIKIADITNETIENISVSDIYEFMNYITTQRNNNAVTRSRKISTLRSFYKYLTTKTALVKNNPVKDFETPNFRKSLPKYLSLEQSQKLLETVDGPYAQRDFCILTLFLNCGMRLSELVSINLADIHNNRIRLIGKGNKERTVYLNDACLDAIEAYIKVRESDISIKPAAQKALFISKQGNRISPKTVQWIVKKNLSQAQLDGYGFSTHKLRHTAATLMYQYGDTDLLVLKEILGHANTTTTEIYTHVANKQIEEAARNSPLASMKPKPKKKTIPRQEKPVK